MSDKQTTASGSTTSNPEGSTKGKTGGGNPPPPHVGGSKPPPPPEWGIDIKCGKGTLFRYGPWADRQRDKLYKFFFPPDYRDIEPTPSPKPGDTRQVSSLAHSLQWKLGSSVKNVVTENYSTKQSFSSKFNSGNRCVFTIVCYTFILLCTWLTKKSRPNAAKQWPDLIQFWTCTPFLYGTPWVLWIAVSQESLSWM